jgi:uncharacterized membrane protein SpoIIM required for sporulation
MEKIPQSWEKNYKPLKLFKDDIEEIVKIITAGPAETDIHIEVDEFRLDNPSELNEIKKDIIKELYIGVETFMLQLRLGRKNAHLWVGDKDNTMLMGIAIRIDEILRKRQRFLGYLSFGIRPQLTYFFLGFPIGVFLFLSFARTSHTPLFVLLLIAFLIIGLGGIAYFLYFQHHFSTIRMFYSYEKPNFFKRNKDTILVNVIVSIVSLVVGVFGTLLAQWITKKF